MATDIAALERAMRVAADAGDFEEAARLRDLLATFRVDESEIHAQVPGRMGIGTSRPRPEAPAGWRPPPKPDPMTRGRKR